jgi:hypothetical protein
MSNSIIFHGVHDSNTEDMPYRKLLCAVIWQAVNHALGRELSDILDPNDKQFKYHKQQERAAAMAYIMSDDFERQCEYLGIDNLIDEIRLKVTRGLTYQMPAFMKPSPLNKEVIKQEYQPKVNTQKEIANKYGVTQQAISAILPKRKHTRITPQDAEKMREEYSGSSVKLREMSAKYGYSQSVISHVINGNYAHMAGAKLEK